MRGNVGLGRDEVVRKGAQGLVQGEEGWMERAKVNMEMLNLD